MLGGPSGIPEELAVVSPAAGNQRSPGAGGVRAARCSSCQLALCCCGFCGSWVVRCLRGEWPSEPDAGVQDDAGSGEAECCGGDPVVGGCPGPVHAVGVRGQGAVQCQAARVVRARVRARPGPGRSSAAGQPSKSMATTRTGAGSRSLLARRAAERPWPLRGRSMRGKARPGLPPARTRSPPARRAGHRSARSKASWSIAECAPSFHGQMLACVNAEARTEPAAA